MFLVTFNPPLMPMSAYTDCPKMGAVQHPLNLLFTASRLCRNEDGKSAPAKKTHLKDEGLLRIDRRRPLDSRYFVCFLREDKIAPRRSEMSFCCMCNSRLY